MTTCPTKPTEEEIELRYRYDEARLKEEALRKRLELAEQRTIHLSERLTQCLCRNLRLSLGMPLTMTASYFNRTQQVSGKVIYKEIGDTIYLASARRDNNGELSFRVMEKSDGGASIGGVTWNDILEMKGAYQHD